MALVGVDVNGNVAGDMPNCGIPEDPGSPGCRILNESDRAGCQGLNESDSLS